MPSGVRAALTCVVAVATVAMSDVRQPDAQDKLPTTVAAVIDYQRILRDAQAARSIRDQMEARRRAYQEEFAKEEQRLHEVDRDLAAQRTVLSADEFTRRRQAFENDVASVQRVAQERRRQLDQAAEAAGSEVRAAVIDVVRELSDARGFNLVVPSSGVLLFSPEIDVTGEVLTRLDRKLPNVKVPE